ncbi:MAG TPA: hypothetical protein VK497_04925 [Candidatus Saccharimonadales bacterium]|nr:hypothetical protein [Candidatus Saccharimonadales bacterium]
MNLREKFDTSPAASVAAVTFAAILAVVIGSAYGDAMTPAQEVHTTTVSMTQPPEEFPPVQDLAEMPCEFFGLYGIDPYGISETCNNPCGYSYNDTLYFCDNLPFGESAWDDEVGSWTVDSDINGSQTVLPAQDPMDIRLLQSDGGFVHCRSMGGIVSKPVQADDSVAINSNLINLWTDRGDLMLSPRDLDIEPGRIAIVVNEAHAAWLPATAAGSQVTLTAYDWLPDITMWWRVQICAFTG